MTDITLIVPASAIWEDNHSVGFALDELYQKNQEGPEMEVLEKAGRGLELARGIEPPTCGLQNPDESKSTEAERERKPTDFLDTWLD